MFRNKKLLLKGGLFLLLAALLTPTMGVAQTQCDYNDLNIIVTDYDLWDWESTNCEMWASRITDGPQPVYPLGIPWSNPSSAKVFQIAQQQDYRKEDGWELIRRDFGNANKPIKTPYFILYNKYRGLLRVFFFMNPLENFTKAVVTLEHSPVNGSNTGNLAHVNFYQEESDSYIAGNAPSNEIEVAANLDASPLTWGVAEFRPSFDPDFADPVYAGNALQIKIWGQTTSAITLAGTSEAFTTAFNMAGDKSVIQSSRTNSNGNAVPKFLTNAGKLSKTIGKVDPETFFTGLAAVASVIATIGTGGAAALPAVVSAASVSKVVKVIKGVTKMAKGGAGVLSAAGLVTGWIDGSSSSSGSSPTPFTPTVTTTTFNLEGEINTEKDLGTIQFQLPGGQKVSNENLPYYDCPLGLFALKNASQVNKIEFLRWEGTITDGNSSGPLRALHSSYRGKDELEFAVNESSGMEVYEIQVALMARPSSPIMESDLGNYYQSGGPLYGEATNRLLDDFETNKLYAAAAEEIVINPEDPNPTTETGITLISTRWVDPGCFGDLSLTVRNTFDAKVFLRVFAVLKKQGENPDTAIPFVYMADYDLEIVQGGTPDYPNYVNGDKFDHPPFTNYFVAGNRDAQVIVTTSNQDAIANRDIFTTGTVDIATGNDISYIAGNSIVLGEGFTANDGSNFLASTEFGYEITCITNVLDVVMAACGYNANAYRMAEAVNSGAEELFTEELKLWPNPTEGALTVQLQQDVEGELVFISLQGKEMLRKVWSRGTRQMEVETGGWTPGFYVAILRTSTGIYRQQLMVK